MNEAERRPSGRTLTRRQLLRYGGYGLLLAPLLPLARGLGPQFAVQSAAAAPNPSGQTQAGEWALAERVRAFGDGAVEFTAPYVFGALGAHWAANGADDDTHLALSTSTDGTTWSAWQTVHPEGHGPDAGQTAGRPNRRFGELLLVAPSLRARCRAVDHAGGPRPFPADLRLVYIDASAGPSVAPEPVLSAFATARPPIITRAQWGCDEKLRLDSKGQEIWEREYYTTEKIIIHHTDTSNSQEPIQAIRAVYYYHAVTQGWGDIGYNFLVDRNGVIYEGRYGGDNVVAGHALQYNYGSVGIALIGEFTPDPPATPTPTPRPGTPGATPTVQPTPIPTPTVPSLPTAAMEGALYQMVAYYGRYLDPQGKYFFIDKMIPNIVGHRDVLSTSCPGANFYSRLPAVRTSVAAINGETPQMDVAIVGVKGNGTLVASKTAYTVTVTVKNTGTAVIPSYFDKGLTYTEGEDYISKKAGPVQGRFRIVADIADSPTARTPGKEPYRWGFGKSLNPGETVDVPCRIAFAAGGTRALTFGLVQETMGPWGEKTAGPTVRVIGNPVDPVAKPTNLGTTMLYFAETGHTLKDTTLRYWNKFGGLAQFGFPLTEEFTELNEADNKEYTVQYFERARFELHPENAGTDYEVLLGLLGRLYHATDAPIKAIDGQRFFAETGHNLSGPFRAYWEAYGGLFIYGLPLTEEFKEKSKTDGKEYTVQYFERARFEYHPENTGKSQVLLGLLGRQLLLDRGWLK